MILLKCCTQYASKFGKLGSSHRTGKSQFSFQPQRRAMPKNACQKAFNERLPVCCFGSVRNPLPLLSHFSRVRLCVTPSLGFSRQEHWSGLPFPSPMHKSEKWKWSRSVMSDSATPWTAAHQAPPSMGFSRWEYWSGVPLPSPVRDPLALINSWIFRN